MPKAGIPKVGIPKTGILKVGKTHIVGIVQKVFSPKGVPRMFDAFLTQF